MINAHLRARKGLGTAHALCRALPRSGIARALAIAEVGIRPQKSETEEREKSEKRK